MQVKAGQDQAAWEEQGWIREQDPRGEAALSCQLVWGLGTVQMAMTPASLMQRPGTLRLGHAHHHKGPLMRFVNTRLRSLSFLRLQRTATMHLHAQHQARQRAVQA